MSEVVFLVGSPRSGTTILEWILGQHSRIADWYEPYFVWERFLSSAESDVWPRAELTDQVRQEIREEYSIFARKSAKGVVLDKTPTHVFNIETIHRTFPKARWIHIIRDGRDVTLSIKKEWDRRRSIVESRDLLGLLRTARAMLSRQPFWRHRWMALRHEAFSGGTLNPLARLNKARWQGQTGWGPRFAGWQECIERCSRVQFHAWQWVKCIEAAGAGWSLLPPERCFEMRYEDLLQQPTQQLEALLAFLRLQADPAVSRALATLNRDNSGKWKDELSGDEVAEIKPILDPQLRQLGYVRETGW